MNLAWVFDSSFILLMAGVYTLVIVKVETMKVARAAQCPVKIRRP